MNLFIQTNKRKLETLMHRLEDLRMKNSPDIESANLPEVMRFIKGLITEIHSLQTENDKLSKKMELYSATEDAQE